MLKVTSVLENQLPVFENKNEGKSLSDWNVSKTIGTERQIFYIVTVTFYLKPTRRCLHIFTVQIVITTKNVLKKVYFVKV